MNATIVTLPRIVRFISGLGLAAFVTWCIFSLRADLGRTSLAAIGHSWHLVLGATALSLLNYSLRSARWHWYLRHLGHVMPLRFSVLVYIAGFAFTLSPSKVGEMMRAHYCARAGVPVRHVTAVFIVERLMDLIAVILLAMLIATSSPEYRMAVWTGACGVAIALLLLTALPWNRIRSLRTSRWPLMVTRPCIEVADTLTHARALLSPRIALSGLVLAAVAWLLEGLGLGLLASMLAPANLSVPVTVGIYAVATLAGVISFLPGGLGTTELVMTGLLTTQGYSIADALSVTLLCRIVTLWFAVGLGWVTIIALRRVAWPRPSSAVDIE